MKNPIFKEAVKAAFEKVGWPHDPAQVAQNLGPGPHAAAISKDVLQGQHLLQEGNKAVRGIIDSGDLIEQAANRVFRPAPAAVSGPVMEALKRVGQSVQSSPGAMRALLGTVAVGPILAKSFNASQQGYEDLLMNMRRDPERTIVASLDEFLEKKAGAPSFGDSVRGGLASGVASGAVNGIFGLLGKGVSAFKDSFITSGQRKRLFEYLLQTDVTLHDEITRKPELAEVLSEAYETMAKFAPSLALDINAVRSFLREVTIGQGVNYATIKNLIETEKAHTEAMNRR